MALGYVIEFMEDPAATTPVAYWNGRATTIDATTTALQESETYIDGELNEVDLMTLVGNIQIANPDKYARLRRVDVTVTLV
jgi:hypothetical protein